VKSDDHMHARIEGPGVAEGRLVVADLSPTSCLVSTTRRHP
jgi:hypothetical protein